MVSRGFIRFFDFWLFSRDFQGFSSGFRGSFYSLSSIFQGCFLMSSIGLFCFPGVFFSGGF